jgi:polyhydroxyalkanoate synthesis regulator phasin
LDIEKDTPPIISKNMADISGEMKRRGRKPSVNTLEKMQSKYYKMYDDLEKQLRAMRELSTKIDDYKKYFGK